MFKNEPIYKRESYYFDAFQFYCENLHWKGSCLHDKFDYYFLSTFYHTPPHNKKHGIYRHLLKAYRNITNILKNFILHKFIYSKPMRHSLTLQKYCGDTENRFKKSDALSYVLVVK